MIAIIDLNNLIQKYGLIPFETSVNCLSFNFNNTLIASSSDDYFIDISHIDEQADKVKYCARINTKSKVNALKWHPKKHMLAFSSSSNDQKTSDNVNIWGALRQRT